MLIVKLILNCIYITKEVEALWKRVKCHDEFPAVKSERVSYRACSLGKVISKLRLLNHWLHSLIHEMLFRAKLQFSPTKEAGTRAELFEA